jgi:hypothetical protein
MFAYRFKISFELNDEFVREIELKTTQTFLDFYNVILDNLQVDKTKPSSFYLCDHKFRKKTKIVPPAENADNPQIDSSTKELRMDQCDLADQVDDPHQKFLFIYDLPNDWNFYIELIKIVPTQANATYPRIVKSLGPTPVEISRKMVLKPGEEVMEDELDEEFIDEDMIELEEEIEEDAPTAELYDEEDLDELNEDSLYNDSIDTGGDFDETRQ